MSTGGGRTGAPAGWQAVAANRAMEVTQGRWGPVQGAFWGTRRSRMAARFVALPGAVAFAALIFGVPFALLAKTGAASVLVVLAIGVVCAAIAYLMLRATRVKDHLAVFLFTGGFVWDDGERAEVVPFDQITDVRRRAVKVTTQYGAEKYSSFTYTISRSDGAQFLIDDRFTGNRQLGDRIMEQVTVLQLGPARERLRRGETLRFEPYEINRQGIGGGGMPFTPWAEVSQVTTADGQLVVRVNGRVVSSEPFENVPNALLLLTLAGELTPASGG